VEGGIVRAGNKPSGQTAEIEKYKPKALYFSIEYSPEKWKPLEQIDRRALL